MVIRMKIVNLDFEHFTLIDGMTNMETEFKSIPFQQQMPNQY